MEITSLALIGTGNPVLETEMRLMTIGTGFLEYILLQWVNHHLFQY